MKIHSGTKVYLSGDSKDMWIEDYNVRVDKKYMLLLILLMEILTYASMLEGQLASLLINLKEDTKDA